jgi:hypothetical protein
MAEARTATDAICARPEVRAALASGDWTVVLRVPRRGPVADDDRGPGRPVPVAGLPAG